MEIIEHHFCFEDLEKLLDLPEDVKIVGITEGQYHKEFKIRFVTTRELPKKEDHYYFCELDQVGDYFVNPDKYARSNKGKLYGSDT